MSGGAIRPWKEDDIGARAPTSPAGHNATPRFPMSGSEELFFTALNFLNFVTFRAARHHGAAARSPGTSRSLGGRNVKESCS